MCATATRRARATTATAVGALTFALALPSVALAASDVLARHAPVLRYDARERSPAVTVGAIAAGRLLDGRGRPLAGRGTPVALSPDLLGARYRPPLLAAASRDHRLDLPRPAGGPPARPLAYARRARGSDGRDWLQYWLFFLANDQDRSPLRTGRHEGDWELVQVRLGAGGRPDRVTLSQHSWAEGCAWGDVEREGGRPVVHVAHASHALYSRAGTGDRPWPDPNDEARGDGRTARPAVVPIAAGSPAWVGWPGRWGASEAGPIPGEHPSPRGPAFQPQARWSDPSRFDAEQARACGAGPPGRPAQTAAIGAVAVLALAALALRRRRRALRRGARPSP